jgi:hypothetical protein
MSGLRRQEVFSVDRRRNAQEAEMTETTVDSTRRRTGVSADLEEAGRAHAHLEQERQREADALQTQATLGAAIVAVLLFFDAVPLKLVASAGVYVALGI